MASSGDFYEDWVVECTNSPARSGAQFHTSVPRNETQHFFVTPTFDDRNPASRHMQISALHRTRIPILLVYAVYIRSRRISTFNSTKGSGRSEVLLGRVLDASGNRHDQMSHARQSVIKAQSP